MFHGRRLQCQVYRRLSIGLHLALAEVCCFRVHLVIVLSVRSFSDAYMLLITGCLLLQGRSQHGCFSFSCRIVFFVFFINSVWWYMYETSNKKVCSARRSRHNRTLVFTRSKLDHLRRSYGQKRFFFHLNHGLSMSKM